MITRFLGNYLILMGGLIAILGVAGEWAWLLNAATAAIGALAVIIGSSVSYKKMVENGVNAQSRDIIEKIEDPHDLYDEEEKAQKPTFGERVKLMRGALSPLRLFGYLILLASFFILYTNGAFLPLPYLAGLLLTPFAVLMLYFQTRQ